MKISKTVKSICVALAISTAGMPMLLTSSAYASTVVPVSASSITIGYDPTEPLSALTMSPAQAQVALDDFYALAEAQGLTKEEADEATGGVPWWVFTTLLGAGGSMAWYLLNVYVWHKQKFSRGGFARAGGCGAIGGLVWGFGGGWAGRNKLRYALVALGAGGLVNVCSGVF